MIPSDPYVTIEQAIELLGCDRATLYRKVQAGELVVKAMENISEIARDNLATVQEMSKATANLAQQAESLARLVSVFKVQ